MFRFIAVILRFFGTCRTRTQTRVFKRVFGICFLRQFKYLAHHVCEVEDISRIWFAERGETDSAIRGSILSFPWRLRYPQKRTTDVAQQRKSAMGVAHTIPNVGYKLFNMNISGISKMPFRSNAKTKEYKLRPTAWKKEMTV